MRASPVASAISWVAAVLFVTLGTLVSVAGLVGAQQPGLPPKPVTIRIVDSTQEIGRASCRERV